MNITNLQPSNVWKNFAALNSVPRPSKKEGKVIEFIRQFGVSLGLETTVDETGNVLIKTCHLRVWKIIECHFIFVFLTTGC